MFENLSDEDYSQNYSFDFSLFHVIFKFSVEVGKFRMLLKMQVPSDENKIFEAKLHSQFFSIFFLLLPLNML